VTYFFDNTFPPQLAKIVAILGVDAVHLHDEFPPNTLDVTWIPEIGRRGWVVITADRGISKKPAERKPSRKRTSFPSLWPRASRRNPFLSSCHYSSNGGRILIALFNA
jgi:PIN like domain